MRRFALGAPTDRKIVMIEVHGTRMSVVRMMPDGNTKRTEKELPNEAEARAVSEQLASELISRGYVEQNGRSPRPSQPVRPRSSSPGLLLRRRRSKKRTPAISSTWSRLPRPPPNPCCRDCAPRANAEPAAGTAKKKPKKPGSKKKKTKSGSPDALDKRVLAGIGAVGAILVAGLAFIVWDQFIRPPSIVGTWRGSLTDYEVGHMITHTKYDLLLDDQKRASLTLQGKFTSVGTYSLKGDRLKLSLKSESEEKVKDDDGDEPAGETEYKVSLGRATLDLIDPATGKLAVQLIRFREPPLIGKKTGPQAAPVDLIADIEKVDKAEDERLAAVEFSAKDGAFKLRHPQGWEPDTGSRPDNTYSWASFTRDSAKIQVHADVKGSLMSGSDSAGQHEEGSESAPVHVAHELYQKAAEEEFSDYKESKPVVFKGSQLGEGRISLFTGSEKGLMGSRLRGYHATLLTKDRRVTILCQCHDKEFAKLKPTFLAVCRSLAR